MHIPTTHQSRQKDSREPHNRCVHFLRVRLYYVTLTQFQIPRVM